MNVETHVHRYMNNKNIKISGKKRTRNVARTKRRAYRILQGKTKITEHLEELGVETMIFKIGPKKKMWEGVY